jgi:hypothetical protein
VLTSSERLHLASSLRDDSFMRMDVKEALSFIVGVLVDYDPVTGQAQLDSVEFPEILELFRNLEGPSSVSPPSDAFVRNVWKELIEERALSIRVRKTVSKCDRCIELRTLTRQVVLLCHEISVFINSVGVC